MDSRSVLLQWWPPDCSKASPDLEFNDSDFRYEVLLSDKGKEGKFKPIYSGAALSCRYLFILLVCGLHIFNI